MDLLDKTRNQHFLPQVEQRLNAIDPLAAKNKQRIYEYEILINSAGEKSLGVAKSRPIQKNLAMLDLFSFDVDKNQPLRQNFEALFHQYEAEVAMNTANLLNKLAAGNNDVSVELVNIYAAKLMNFARNPYSVPKILATFGELARYTPQDAVVHELFQKVLKGRRQHEKHLCKILRISNTQYKAWLQMLFNMLVVLKPGHSSLFDETVRAIFTSRQYALGVLVCTYSTQHCLLSDRAMSTNAQTVSANGFDFNLNSRAFIRYIVMDRNMPNIPNGIRQVAIHRFMNSDLPINLHWRNDDEDLLRSFNSNIVEQSHSHVYCATNQNLIY